MCLRNFISESQSDLKCNIMHEILNKINYSLTNEDKIKSENFKLYVYFKSLTKN